MANTGQNFPLNIMAEALRNHAGKDNSGMISETLSRAAAVEAKARQIAKQERRLRLLEQKQRLHERELDRIARLYHSSILRTAREGLWGLSPCSLFNWLPPKSALADGKPCRIKWGLSDGNNHFAVVLFEYPQPLVGLEGRTTELGFYPVSALKPCDCRGYIHKRGCDLPRKKKPAKRKPRQKQLPKQPSTS